MLEKEPLENDTVRVTFRVSHYIWGDSISLVLPTGNTYRFRYLVDGKEWMEDDHADRTDPNPFGGFDSVVVT